jgi:hypothetical protein
MLSDDNDMDLADATMLAEDEDLSLDLDAGEPEAAPVSEGDSDDLDLSDLGDMLSDDNDMDLADATMLAEDQDLSLDPEAGESIEDVGDVTELVELDDAFGDASPEEDVDISDDIDLSALDDIIAEGDGGDIADEIDLDQENLDLSLDDTPTETPASTNDEDDVISFDDSALEDAPSVELSSSTEDFDLGDLGDLVSEEVSEVMDDDLEIPREDQELSLDLDGGEAIDMDLDESGTIELDSDDVESITGDTDSDDEDEIDLSGLDSILGEDAVEADSGDMTILADDIDSSLDVLDGESGEDAAEEVADDELEDLDFKLDAEFEDKPVAQADETQPPSEEAPDEETILEDDSEIDLSDIEEMLEGGELAAGTGGFASSDIGDQETMSGAEEFDLTEFEAAIDEADGPLSEEGQVGEDLDLEFDLSLDDGDGEGEAIQQSASDDFDLDLGSEETILEDDLELEIQDQPEEQSSDDLDFDLELESDSPSSGEIELESDDLDLSDLQGLVDEPDVSSKSEIVDSGDIELEFEIEERGAEPKGAASVTSEPITAERTADAVTELAMDETITTPLEPAAAPEPVAKRPKPVKPAKKGSKKSLLVVLILILLGGGGYLGYDYIVKNDIQIPYLSEYINPRPKDPSGTLNLSTMEITSKFIENEQNGRLFVITGKVRNGYQDTRSMVSLRGKLYSKGKILVKTERAYAGVVLKDQELATRPVQEVKNQLKATPKPQDIGTLMRPGQTLPFMMVFSDLPDDLDEFAIETVGSQPVQ